MKFLLRAVTRRSKDGHRMSLTKFPCHKTPLIIVSWRVSNLTIPPPPCFGEMVRLQELN